MYLDEIAATIRAAVPPDKLPQGSSDELFLGYAVLARAKGEDVAHEDVHDVWAAWMATQDRNHPALIEYERLPPENQQQDAVYVRAIRWAAAGLNREASRRSFDEILFPLGLPREPPERRQTLDLYKVMVQSSEGLVARRQGVNTFFLTMNGALVTAIGLILQYSGANSIGALGIAVLSFAGVILCGAWHSLITSFGQLNTGKFKVINAIEKYMRAAIYAAEWEALGRGENPKIYRSFTSREIWVPTSLLALHYLTLAGALAIYLGWLNLK
jgi:hypothetical protein